MRNSSFRFLLILLELHRCFGHGIKMYMWFGYNNQIIFCHLSRNLNLVFFQALLLSTYVDSMYLARVTPPINFKFSDDSLFLKKNLGGGHKFSELACINACRWIGYQTFNVPDIKLYLLICYHRVSTCLQMLVALFDVL